MIKFIKDDFEKNLASQLNLERISAPLFVEKDSGLNDNLDGSMRVVSFDIKNIPNVQAEIVQSLAKWKRWALKEYEFNEQEGLYTDMNAIRRDDSVDEIHSIYVDQWDWEKVISIKDRNEEYLKNVVNKIVYALNKTNNDLFEKFNVKCDLNENVTFITSEELLKLYPNLDSKQREYEFTKLHKTVFIMQIGDTLSNGEIHDKRAPDYDDWSLNGDILCYHQALDIALEISSMGIRVTKESLIYQLTKSNCLDRVTLPFHKALLSDKLPYTIGGGIGQSRLCMLLLNARHIGEVQSSIWSEKMRLDCHEKDITLL